MTLAVLEKRLRLRLPAPARAALKADIRVRTALLLAATATDPAKYYSRETTVLAKTCRVFCAHTFRALLGDEIATGLRYGGGL